MKVQSFFCRSFSAGLLALILVLGWPLSASAQTCLAADDLDAGARNNLEQTAQHFFQLSAAADYAGLKAAAIPSLAANFGGVERAITDYKPDFTGAQATPSSVFVLENATKETMPRAEFYCGIFNSANRVGFVIPNLEAGRYAVVTENVSGGKQPLRLTFVMKQEGTHWALAGYTVKPMQIAGHDVTWYLTQARQFKARGDHLTAYLYYLEAWYLSQPIDIEYTPQQDKLADEMQQARPAEWPTPAQPMNLMAAGKTYRVTQLFPDTVSNDLYLVIKYRATTDLSDTAAAFQDNMTVMRSMVSRYPELRSAFAGVVARAVDPSSGRDYGSLLAMKDVK